MDSHEFLENLIFLNSLKTLKLINYSKSFRFGFLDGSLERSPKINKETKKIIVV
jgi:hypothetical protein